MISTQITKKDTLWLRGFAILSIVFHNFFHMLDPIVGENEFYYVRERFENFLYYLEIDPLNFIHYIAAYFGHYGVPIFVFLSGYGLAKSYETRPLFFKKFITVRLIKIYPAFTIGLLFTFVYLYVVFELRPVNFRLLGSFVIRYTQVANFLPDKACTFNSAYWFYAMIIQLYFCFYVLFHFHKKYKLGLWFLCCISYVFTICFNGFFSEKGVFLYANFIGNLPVFIFGILVASNSIKQLSFPMFLGALFIFVLGQWHEIVWYFSQLSVVVIILFLFKRFHGVIKFNNSFNFMRYTGQLSMYLFVVGGLLRMPWLDFSNSSANKIYTYLYFGIYLIITYILALGVKRIEIPIQVYLEKKYVRRE